jgi:hypothetical protein
VLALHACLEIVLDEHLEQAPTAHQFLDVACRADRLLGFGVTVLKKDHEHPGVGLRDVAQS